MKKALTMRAFFWLFMPLVVATSRRLLLRLWRRRLWRRSRRRCETRPGAGARTISRRRRWRCVAWRRTVWARRVPRTRTISRWRGRRCVSRRRTVWAITRTIEAIRARAIPVIVIKRVFHFFHPVTRIPFIIGVAIRNLAVGSPAFPVIVIPEPAGLGTGCGQQKKQRYR